MEYLAVFFILLLTQGVQTFVLWYLLTPLPAVIPQSTLAPKPTELQVRPQRERSGLSITHVPCVVANTEERFAVRLIHDKPPDACRTKDGTGALRYTGSKDPNGAYIYELTTE